MKSSSCLDPTFHKTFEALNRQVSVSVPASSASAQWNSLEAGVKTEWALVRGDMNLLVAPLAAEARCGSLSQGTRHSAVHIGPEYAFEKDDSCSSHVALRGVI